MLSYLWLSRKASFPFLQEIIPRGDILGRHSISTSPPCRARVWLRTAFAEKSGATAAQGRDARHGSDSAEKKNLKLCRRNALPKHTQELLFIINTNQGHIKDILMQEGAYRVFPLSLSPVAKSSCLVENAKRVDRGGQVE